MKLNHTMISSNIIIQQTSKQTKKNQTFGIIRKKKKKEYKTKQASTTEGLRKATISLTLDGCICSYSYPPPNKEYNGSRDCKRQKGTQQLLQTNKITELQKRQRLQKFVNSQQLKGNLVGSQYFLEYENVRERDHKI